MCYCQSAKKCCFCFGVCIWVPFSRVCVAADPKFVGAQRHISTLFFYTAGVFIQPAEEVSYSYLAGELVDNYMLLASVRIPPFC